jgi:alpha-L-fucosidase
MANYTSHSPWYRTRIINDQYLGILNIRPIPAENDDIVYQIETQYTYRPDLLAYDLYGSEKLWWVFAQRNLDLLKDPIYDFKPGLEIYLPQGNRLRDTLGY